MSINDFKNTEDNKWCNTDYNKWRGIWSPSDSSAKLPPDSKEIGIGTSVSSGDYGRKPYISKNYKEMMKRPTISATQNQLKTVYGKFEPKSEFEKPYLADSYEEMQHYQPPAFPNFAWPTWSFPGFGGPIPDPEVPDEISKCTYCIIITHDETCNDTCDDCYGESHVSVACFKGSPSANSKGQQYTWDVNGENLNHIDYYGTAICSRKLFTSGSGGYGNCIKIYPDWDSIESDGDWKKADYSITLTDGLGHKCSDKIEIKCPSCICAETNVAYSPDNDDTIDRGETVIITVTDGCPPFRWLVEGEGFTIPSETEDRTNILSASDTACGSAFITVTDRCNDVCTGWVRGTEGHWVQKQVNNINACGLPDTVGTSSPCGAGCTSWVLIIDYMKQEQVTYNAGGCGFSDPVSCCECDNCCNPGGSGCAGWACLPCIDYDSEYGYTVPFFNILAEPSYSRKVRNTSLIYSEWEC